MNALFHICCHYLQGNKKSFIHIPLHLTIDIVALTPVSLASPVDSGFSHPGALLMHEAAATSK